MSGPSVVIAVADAPTRMGLQVVLTGAGCAVAAAVADADAAVAAVLPAPPDVAVVDLDIPGGGIDAVRRISVATERTAILALAGEVAEDELLVAVLAGAAGYVSKRIGNERLPAIVQGLAAGEVALPRHMTGRLLAELRNRDRRRSVVSRNTSAPLTAREWEILNLVVAEIPTAVMAHRLGISEVTVRRHVSGLLGKLGVRNRQAAVALMRSTH